ncbi:MAG: hypothetical protein KBE65_20910 [Phycisphaerae bacterium]|nr:hypothetical protein [Phycisphaerae bacterium]
MIQPSAGLAATSLALCAVAVTMAAGPPDRIELTNTAWRVTIWPQTLRIVGAETGREPVELSAGQSDLGPVSQLARSSDWASWSLRDEHIAIAVRLDANDLHMRIQSNGEGAFTWPTVRLGGQVKALIWPCAEGAYIPLDEARWIDYLVSRGEWDTLASLSMPFWGLDCGQFLLTYIATCPYNNTIRFVRKAGEVRATFTHEFTRFQEPKEYGFVISLGENRSPVLPAQRFRRWLVEHGQFVSMRDKREQIPKVERLLGAAHVYLWGDGVSLDMLERFHEAGFDRLRLCTDGWEEVETVALTEVLYMAVPMYHMHLDEFDKHGAVMKKHYEFFSPLHRELGFARMTDFAWLSKDRLLQRTTFDDRVELIANYSTEAGRNEGMTIPGRSVLARWKQPGVSRLYTPTAHRQS